MELAYLAWYIWIPAQQIVIKVPLTNYGIEISTSKVIYDRGSGGIFFRVMYPKSGQVPAPSCSQKD